MTSDQGWRAKLKNWPHQMPVFEIDPRSSALVIVDMQNSTANLDHGWNKLLTEQYPEIAAYLIPRLRDVVIPNNQRLMDFFRQRNRPIIYLTVSRSRADGRDWPTPLRRRYNHFEGTVERRMRADQNSFDSQVIEELKPAQDDLVLNKTSTSPFNSTGIEHYLRNMEIKSLVITGVATNSCVESTMRDAVDRGFDCYLIEDACATLDPIYHEATLLNCQMIFGNVYTTTEVIEKFIESISDPVRVEAL
jgi:nicotinamidase-related amidase